MKYVAKSVNVIKSILSDGEEGGFSVFQYAQVGFFAQVAGDGVTDGCGLCLGEFLGDAICRSEQCYCCGEEYLSDMWAAI